MDKLREILYKLMNPDFMGVAKSPADLARRENKILDQAIKSIEELFDERLPPSKPTLHTPTLEEQYDFNLKNEGFNACLATIRRCQRENKRRGSVGTYWDDYLKELGTDIFYISPQKLLEGFFDYLDKKNLFRQESKEGE